MGLTGGGKFSAPAWSIEPREGDKIVENVTFLLYFSNTTSKATLQIEYNYYQYDENNKWLGTNKNSKNFDIPLKYESFILQLLEQNNKNYGQINIKD